MQKVVPFLWFTDQAEAAARFYTSVFKNSKIAETRYYGAAGPGAPGSVMSVGIAIGGLEFICFNGGPMFTFSPAISLFINCDTQQEVDELWETLSAGGSKNRCGWLTDKFGVTWQVVPTILGELLQDKDANRAARVMQAMMKMDKLDGNELQRVYAQNTSGA